MAAAAALLAAHPACAETPPERASIAFKYLDYHDWQPGLDRIRVRAPSLSLVTPFAGDWSFDGTVVWDSISGASPAFHTVERSAARLEDKRKAADVGVTRYWPGATLKLGAAYSTESDYVSRALSATGSLSTDDRNTTFRGGLSVANDRISPNNKVVVDERKNTTDVLLGVTQVLTQRDIAQVDLTVGRGNGYFSDPYKSLDDRPRSRRSSSLVTRWNHHFDGPEATLRLNYRYYSDSFAIRAHTLGAEWVQPLPAGWTVTPSARLYSQGAAKFYVDVDPRFPTRLVIPADFSPGQPISFDQRLASFGARTFGIKVAKQWADWQVDAKYEHYTQRSEWAWHGGGSPGLAKFRARMVQVGVTRYF
ncbi:MAG: DUF3570 domain-containing protein [Burkholderiales bacterium]|nr:DUF3570 domain-containing protein [Burkholderiales bacterium]